TRWPRDWSSDVCSSDLLSSILYGTGMRSTNPPRPIAAVLATFCKRMGRRLRNCCHSLSRSCDNAFPGRNHSERVADIGQTQRKRSEERRVGKEGGGGRG